MLTSLRRALLAILATTTFAVAVEPGANLNELALPLRSGAITVKPYAGKVVYLDIWASWCGPCRQSMPFMASLQQRFGARGLEVVAVSIDTETAALDAFLAKHHPGVTIGHDPEGVLPRTLAVEGMPTALLIDRTGVVRRIHGGFRADDAAALEAEVERLLGAEGQ